MAYFRDPFCSESWRQTSCVALAVALLTACPGKDPGDEPGTGTSSSDESGPASATEPLQTGTDSQGPDTSTSTGTTDGPTTSGTGFLTTLGTTGPGDTEGETAGDTENTGGGPLPALCSEQQPGVSAAFETTVDTFGDVVPCTVDAVSIEAGMVVTALTCDARGGVTTGTLRMAEASEGPPTWKAADEVTLRSASLSDIGFDETWRHFVLRRAADDSLLAVGIDRDTIESAWLAPIVLERSYPCGPHDDPDPFSNEHVYQLDFTLADETLSLPAFHRGSLSIDEVDEFAIDVERAVTNICCHFEGGHWQNVLVRRVRKPI